MGEQRAELGCEEVEALLPLVAEGAITPEDDAELFAHLAECPDCQADLALHDLTTLALSHGREPQPVAGDEAAEVIRLPWTAVAGGLLVAAGLVVAAWLGLSGAEPIAPVAEPPRTTVVDVRIDEDGNEVFVVEQDGELIEVRNFDRGDERAGGAGSVSTPVGMPRR